MARRVRQPDGPAQGGSRKAQQTFFKVKTNRLILSEKSAVFVLFRMNSGPYLKKTFCIGISCLLVSQRSRNLLVEIFSFREPTDDCSMQLSSGLHRSAFVTADASPSYSVAAASPAAASRATGMAPASLGLTAEPAALFACLSRPAMQGWGVSRAFLRSTFACAPAARRMARPRQRAQELRRHAYLTVEDEVRDTRRACRLGRQLNLLLSSHAAAHHCTAARRTLGRLLEHASQPLACWTAPGELATRARQCLGATTTRPEATSKLQVKSLHPAGKDLSHCALHGR